MKDIDFRKQVCSQLKMTFIDNVIYHFTGFIFILLNVLVILQVFFRNFAATFKIDVPFWTEDIARYLLVLVVFFGAAGCFLKKDGHIAIEIISNRLNKKVWHILEIVKYFFIMILNLLLLYGAYILAFKNMNNPVPSFPEIKIGWFYWGIFFALAYTIVNICRWIFVELNEYKIL